MRSNKIDHEAERIRAVANGLIEGGFRRGSAEGHRTFGAAAPTSRRRCSCGCGSRASFVGYGDGVALMMGCEISVRRWVRDGYTRKQETNV